MPAERTGKATWQGDLMSGSGEIQEAPSGATARSVEDGPLYSS